MGLITVVVSRVIMLFNFTDESHFLKAVTVILIEITVISKLKKWSELRYDYE